MSCYVLWIPCLTNVTPSPIKGEIKDHNISDTDVNRINATIDRDTWEIAFTYQYNGSQRITLASFQDSFEGLLYYRLKEYTESDSTLIKTLKKELHVGIYHIIKEFFHQHNFHPDEEDSILHGRYFPSIEEYLHQPIGDHDCHYVDKKYFIDEYYEKFKTSYNDINEKIESLKQQKGSFLKYKKIYEGHKRILELINRFLGEYLYYKTLITGFQDYARVKEIEAWKQILSIKKEEINTRFSYNSADYGTKYSCIGLVISLVSIVIAICTIILDHSGDERQLIRQNIEQQDILLQQQIAVTDTIKQTIEENNWNMQQNIFELKNLLQNMDKNIKKVNTKKKQS